MRRRFGNLKRTVGAVAAGLVTTATVVAASPGAVQPLNMSAKIVNGLETQLFPSVVWLQIGSPPTVCTGTLIGCETVLTAAHCYCGATSFAECPALNPADTLVYAQHGGLYGVSSIAIHPGFDFGVATSDLAVLRLSTPVTGIAPSSINTTASPAFGTDGTIVGFGKTEAEILTGFPDNGLKRFGSVVTSTCAPFPDAPNTCWSFLALGGPGVDSMICQGDSGGPLFTATGLAGVTSANAPAVNMCLAPSLAIDSDVFFDRAWIQSEGGSDLSSSICGSIPQAGESNTQILGAANDLSVAASQYHASFEIPAETSLARITLNTELGFGNDFDLYIKAGSPPATSDFDCASLNGVFRPESCEFSSPSQGTWHLLVDRFAGAGRFQTTVTLFGKPGPCVEDLANGVACLQSGRFRLETTYVRQGVIEHYILDKLNDEVVLGFYNHQPTNLVTMQKVRDNCGPSDVFTFWWGGITRFESTADLTDLQDGERRVYTSPAGGVPESIRDATWSCN